MPVGFAEIHPYAHPLLPECLEYLSRNIALRMICESALGVGDLVFGISGVEHTKAIVVLSRKNQIFHACLAASLCPALRVKLLRVEFVPDFLVLPHIS